MGARRGDSRTDAATGQVGRTFTVSEAQRALPLVRRIVRDIVTEFQRLKELHARCRELSRTGPRSSFEAVQQAHARVVDRLNALAEELSQVGCILEDWESGVVDFPGWHEGRPVYFCWRYDEPTVEHWHERGGRWLERRPLAAEVVGIEA